MPRQQTRRNRDYETDIAGVYDPRFDVEVRMAMGRAVCHSCGKTLPRNKDWRVRSHPGCNQESSAGAFDRALRNAGLCRISDDPETGGPRRYMTDAEIAERDNT